MSKVMRVLTETVTIPPLEGTPPDGPPMHGYLARPDTTGPLTGVVVGMELFGVSAHVRDVCDHLADLGYLALAPDLYHRHATMIELPEDDHGRASGFELLHQLTRPRVLADLRATLDYLQNRCSTFAGMVGLSVGGHVAYFAATELDLPAVVIAYGGWIPTTDIPLSRPQPTLTKTPGITGRVLLLIGEQDQLIPAEQRHQLSEALTNADIAHELVEYPDTGHGFLNPRRDSYQAFAAQDAWQRIEKLLSHNPASASR
jgi:carboxymethylenebutenolidase